MVSTITSLPLLAFVKEEYNRAIHDQTISEITTPTSSVSSTSQRIFWRPRISRYIISRWRLTYLIFHGIYMLFVDFFWSQNTFWLNSSLFVGLSFLIFLIRFTNNFWFLFCHLEILLRQKIKTKEPRFCGINYFLVKKSIKMPKCAVLS